MIWLSIILIITAVILLIIAFYQENSSDRQGFGIATVVAVFAALVCFVMSFLTVVPAGHVGVPVVFGKVQENSIPEGLHTKNIFARVLKLSVRTEVYTMSSVTKEGAVEGDDAIKALSSDGLLMPLEITIAYKLVGSDAPWIYRHLGEQYVETVIRSASRTAVREATSKFTSQEAYATKREELAMKMHELLTVRIKDLLSQYKEFKGTGFEIQQVMLRDIGLPDKVKTAIEEKLSAEQDALQMQFVLQKETQEAERKRIEASGIRDFQNIVTAGISDKLLRWKGIEATRELAQSKNAIVVVIGSGTEGGLPIILNPAGK